MHFLWMSKEEEWVTRVRATRRIHLRVSDYLKKKQREVEYCFVWTERVSLVEEDRDMEEVVAEKR